MRVKSTLGVIIALSGLSLGTTEANACIFGRCRVQRRAQVVCPPGYSQAPSLVAPAKQAPVAQAPAESALDRLIAEVESGRPFSIINNQGQVQQVILQLVPVAPAQ